MLAFMLMIAALRMLVYLIQLLFSCGAFLGEFLLEIHQCSLGFCECTFSFFLGLLCSFQLVLPFHHLSLTAKYLLLGPGFCHNVLLVLQLLGSGYCKLFCVFEGTLCLFYVASSLFQLYVFQQLVLHLMNLPGCYTRDC